MLKATTVEHGDCLDYWDTPECKMLQIEFALHGADLSNACRSHDIALCWAYRVMSEFFVQGDRERDVGREISPLCDRNTVVIPTSQINFINFVVKPLFSALSPICNLQPALDHITDRQDYWTREKEHSESNG